MNDPGTMTRSINAIASGQLPTDADPAILRLYQELRELACSRLARSPSDSLQATDLVHEAFVKLFRPGQKQWQSRAHFFGSAARAMQQILIDHWRASGSSCLSHEELDQFPAAAAVHPRALAEAVDELGALDRDIAEIVRLRIFAGLSVEQTAGALGVSERTVKRHFAFARTWLFQRLAEPGKGAGMGQGATPEGRP